MYTYGINYDTTNSSHMMKNSEWGAVAYLTHSQYGRNAHEIYINNSSTYITGNSGGSINATAATGITNAYNTTNGVKASSTGNISGIYDLSGITYEFVAAFNSTDGYSREGQYGGSFASTSNSSTKYATKYYSNKKIGDASKEVFVASELGWFNDKGGSIASITPFIVRGGYYNDGSNAGVFAVSGSAGNGAANRSFRVVLV